MYVYEDKCHAYMLNNFTEIDYDNVVMRLFTDTVSIQHTLHHRCTGGTQGASLKRVRDVPCHELPCQDVLKDQYYLAISPSC